MNSFLSFFLLLFKLSKQCLPCIPGTYNGLTGQESCKICVENTFTNSTEKQSCEPCGTGEKAVAGSAKCSKCDAGESGTGVGGKCEVCAKGQYRTSAMDADSCAPCAAGFAQELTGQASVSFLWYFLISVDIGMNSPITSSPSLISIKTVSSMHSR